MDARFRFIDLNRLRRELLRERSRLGLSQAQIAAAVGVSQGTISAFERGNRRLRPPQAAALGELVEGLSRQQLGSRRENSIGIVSASINPRRCPFCGGSADSGTPERWNEAANAIANLVREELLRQ